MAAIAPSSAARQGLLAEYFDANEDDQADGLKVPTAAHNAIAQLVKAGWIKVVVTPLTHADATIIKLHGDWKDLEFRNTLEELDT